MYRYIPYILVGPIEALGGEGQGRESKLMAGSYALGSVQGRKIHAGFNFF